jgi:hypothetical protein
LKQRTLKALLSGSILLEEVVSEHQRKGWMDGWMAWAGEWVALTSSFFVLSIPHDIQGQSVLLYLDLCFIVKLISEQRTD